MPPKKIDYNYTVNYFKTMGYPEHIAKGIAGNIGVESEFNTTSVNPKSKMKGLAQWDTKRRAALANYAKQKNQNVDDPDLQLSFIHHELSGSEKAAKDELMKAKTVEEAADIFGLKYERYNQEDGSRGPRVYYATEGKRPPKDWKSPYTYSTTQTTTPMATNLAKQKALENNKLATAEGKSTDYPMTPIKRKQRMEKIAQRLVDMPDMYTPEKETPKSQPSRLSSIAENVMPYFSNLYNLGVKPAMVPRPVMGQPVSYQRMNMDVDRTQTEGDYRTVERTAQATLDPSAAMRAMLAGKAAKFGQMSKINEAERNTNIEISNKEREANMAVDAVNRAALYNYSQQQAERENAIKADRTANIANASDKYIAQQTRRAQQGLEERKMEIMSRYDQFKNLKYLMGEDDEKTPKEKEAMGGYLPKKGMGGKLYTAGRFMKTLKPIKTIK